MQLSYHRAPVLFCTANIYKHQEYGDQQCHASRNHIDWYEETNEAGKGQEESRQVYVDKEPCWTSLQDNSESTFGERFIYIPVEMCITLQFFQGKVKLFMFCMGSEYNSGVEFLESDD